IVHSKAVLEFLVGNVSADRVLLGSDYPFDMGMPEGVSQVRGLPISEAEQSAILGGRARALLGAAGGKARGVAWRGGSPLCGRAGRGETEEAEKGVRTGGRPRRAR